MENVEITGKTVEEAIELALKELGVSKEEAEIQVLSRGRAGILGIGAEPARVRASIIKRTPHIAALAKEVLEKLLNYMAVKATVYLKSQVGEDGAGVALEIGGEDSGLLIGRRGETLSSLQFVVSLLVNRRLKEKSMVTLDVEGYKQRRYEALRKLALRMAERVKSSGRPISLEPMPPNERRIVHMALSEHPDVTTQSTGVREARKVTIQPKMT